MSYLSMRDTLDCADKLRAEHDALALVDVLALPSDAALLAVMRRVSRKTARVPLEDALVLVDALLYQVGNGGFDQFFFQESGARARDTVTALELLGCTRMATTLQRAINAFPDADIPADTEQRRARMRGAQDPRDTWDVLDSLFYDMEAESLDVIVAHLRSAAVLDLPPIHGA
ncbi:MAG: DUF4375 domain-containing protein [Myxococcota bacterium]